MSQAEFKKRLKVLMNKPENQVCSDCPERQPRWASLIKVPDSPPGSLPMGAFCCLECSGSHRRLGVHITFVRSVNLDSWKEKEVLAMENGGNKKVNALFEARLSSAGHARKPTNIADGPTRERFIRDKYERRKYYDGSALANYESSSEEEEEVAPQKSKRVVRQPSEAARLRAAKKGVAVPPRATSQPKAPPPAAAAPQVDLLDFGAFDAAPAPAPAAPAPAAPAPAAPAATPASPELDLFANMTVSSNTSSMAPPPASPVAPARTTNDQILAMFNAPQPMAPTAVAMNTPNGGMMMAAGTMPQQQNPMMNNNNMMMMQQQPNMMQAQQPNMMANGYNMQQQQQMPNTMVMQQQGNAMLMQQQGNQTFMMQKTNTGNVMMMQNTMPQQQPMQQQDFSSMRMMQQASNADGFGFPQVPMGSGPAMQNGGGTTLSPNAMGGSAQTSPTRSSDDPFSQFGMNVFR